MPQRGHGRAPSKQKRCRIALRSRPRSIQRSRRSGYFASVRYRKQTGEANVLGLAKWPVFSRLKVHEQARKDYHMAVYMIAYELHEGEDYEGDLIKAIKALPSGGSWHNLGSTWFVISKEAAVQIHNSLKRHLLEGDKLAVVQCGNWGAWSGFNDEASEWLTNALKNEA